MAQSENCALRWLWIMGLFGERQNWTTLELAERTRVGRRTIERDLLILQGEPFYMPLINDDNVWSVIDGWRARL